MEIKLELFASPFLSFHSNGSSGVICYSVAWNKLLWEHRSWDDYPDRSHSAEWRRCKFISLKFSLTLSGVQSLFYKRLMTSQMFFALIVQRDQMVGRHWRTRPSFLRRGGKIKSDGIMMKRATLLTQLWKAELEGANRWQLFAVLDCMFLMRISSVAAQLPTC